MENGNYPEGQKIGYLWYASKQDLEVFLEGNE
jgi:hypothetical protein